MEKFKVLRKCDVFHELNDEHLTEMAKICTPSIFEVGTIIYRQGAKEDKLYVIEDGLVGIILETGPLSQRQVQAVSNFEAFGWSAMVEPYICTATVKALEKTKTLAFKKEDVCDLCHHKPEVSCVCNGITRILAARLRQAYTQLLGVTHQD